MNCKYCEYHGCSEVGSDRDMAECKLYVNNGYIIKIEKLQAENDKLRKVLEYIQDGTKCRCQFTMHQYCIHCEVRQALKGDTE